jgi:hypothetical protein
MWPRTEVFSINFTDFHGPRLAATGKMQRRTRAITHPLIRRPQPPPQEIYTLNPLFLFRLLAKVGNVQLDRQFSIWNVFNTVSVVLYPAIALCREILSCLFQALSFAHVCHLFIPRLAQAHLLLPQQQKYHRPEVPTFMQHPAFQQYRHTSNVQRTTLLCLIQIW